MIDFVRRWRHHWRWLLGRTIFHTGLVLRRGSKTLIDQGLDLIMWESDRRGL